MAITRRGLPGARTEAGGDERVGGSALPGLGFVTLGVALTAVGSTVAGATSFLAVAVAVGVLAANTRMVPVAAAPGLRLAQRHLLRVGVVLLGLRLDLADVVGLGGRGLLVVLAVVASTFVGTRWLARRLSLPSDQALLVATGFSICGVSAIAAMESAVEADEEDVVVAVALVTLCGTLAILVLPALGSRLGLDDTTFGAWAGASVHDVGQVIATASTVGSEAVTSAVTVKLSRVILLAPLVVTVSLWTRRNGTEHPGHRDGVACDPAGESRDAGSSADGVPTAGAPARRVGAMVPLFVVGFIASAALRSSNVLPSGVLSAARGAETLLFGAAMLALGTSVRLSRLRRLGLRPLALGLLAWVLVAGVGLLGIHFVEFD